MTLFEIILLGSFLSVVVMLGCWLWQMRSRDAGIVDIAWSFCIGGLVLLYAMTLEEGVPALRWGVATLTAIWAFRLGINLIIRNHGHGEDGRYAALREHWKGQENQQFLWFFLAQAAVAVLFSLPALAVMLSPEMPDMIWLVLGAAIWATALIGESVADHQLNRFRSKIANAGRTCREGLWRYSRHPNYFFEWVHWFAYPLLAINSPIAAWVWASPVVMYLFLRYFTGIPYTEIQALKSRGDDYRSYQCTTNAFFPWPPAADTSSEGTSS